MIYDDDALNSDEGLPGEEADPNEEGLDPAELGEEENEEKVEEDF